MINPFSIRLPSQSQCVLLPQPILPAAQRSPDGMDLASAGRRAVRDASGIVSARARRAIPPTEQRERPEEAPAADSPAAIVVSRPSQSQHAAASIPQ